MPSMSDVPSGHWACENELPDGTLVEACEDLESVERRFGTSVSMAAGVRGELGSVYDCVAEADNQLETKYRVRGEANSWQWYFTIGFVAGFEYDHPDRGTVVVSTPWGQTPEALAEELDDAEIIPLTSAPVPPLGLDINVDSWRELSEDEHGSLDQGDIIIANGATSIVIENDENVVLAAYDGEGTQYLGALTILDASELETVLDDVFTLDANEVILLNSVDLEEGDDGEAEIVEASECSVGDVVMDNNGELYAKTFHGKTRYSRGEQRWRRVDEAPNEETIANNRNDGDVNDIGDTVIRLARTGVDELSFDALNVPEDVDQVDLNALVRLLGEHEETLTGLGFDTMDTVVVTEEDENQEHVPDDTIFTDLRNNNHDGTHDTRIDEVVLDDGLAGSVNSRNRWTDAHSCSLEEPSIPFKSHGYELGVYYPASNSLRLHISASLTTVIEHSHWEPIVNSIVSELESLVSEHDYEEAIEEFEHRRLLERAFNVRELPSDALFLLNGDAARLTEDEDAASAEIVVRQGDTEATLFAEPTTSVDENVERAARSIVDVRSIAEEEAEEVLDDAVSEARTRVENNVLSPTRDTLDNLLYEARAESRTLHEEAEEATSDVQNAVSEVRDRLDYFEELAQLGADSVSEALPSDDWYVRVDENGNIDACLDTVQYHDNFTGCRIEVGVMLRVRVEYDSEAGLWGKTCWTENGWVSHKSHVPHPHMGARNTLDSDEYSEHARRVSFCFGSASVSNPTASTFLDYLHELNDYLEAVDRVLRSVTSSRGFSGTNRVPHSSVGAGIARPTSENERNVNYTRYFNQRVELLDHVSVDELPFHEDTAREFREWAAHNHGDDWVNEHLGPENEDDGGEGNEEAANEEEGEVMTSA